MRGILAAVRRYVENAKVEADAIEARWFPSQPQVQRTSETAAEIVTSKRLTVRLMLSQDDRPGLPDAYAAYERSVYDGFMAEAKQAYEIAAWKMADVEEDIDIANRAGGISHVLREDHRMASWDLDRACDVLIARKADWMHRKHAILNVGPGL